ncbi:hypothetical protein [Umezawaea sp.]|uniref:hypothetical protein n=1 Tax=Umezawaea sp. TaxID=1955258 RepID=UPI002ED1404B
MRSSTGCWPSTGDGSAGGARRTDPTRGGTTAARQRPERDRGSGGLALGPVRTAVAPPGLARTAAEESMAISRRVDAVVLCSFRRPDSRDPVRTGVVAVRRTTALARRTSPVVPELGSATSQVS